MLPGASVIDPDQNLRLAGHLFRVNKACAYNDAIATGIAQDLNGCSIQFSREQRKIGVTVEPRATHYRQTATTSQTCFAIVIGTLMLVKVNAYTRITTERSVLLLRRLTLHGWSVTTCWTFDTPYALSLCIRNNGRKMDLAC